MKKITSFFFIGLFFIISISITRVNPADISPTPEVIDVTNETELIAAIGSNRIIQLAPGIYNLSTLADSESMEPNCFIQQQQMNIQNIENLTLFGLGDQPVQIVTENPSAYVLIFMHTQKITLRNIEAGHQVEPGSCDGGVLSFTDCTNTLIQDSILYGSGIEGLTLKNIDSFQFINSTIQDCTYGIMTVVDSKNLIFSNSFFRNNQQYNLINLINTSNILFDNCEISNNSAVTENNRYQGNGLFNLFSVSNLSLKNSRIQSNTAQYLICADDKKNIRIQNTVFQDNAWLSGGFYFPIEGISMNFSNYPILNANLSESYKQLEYLSRKLNDPAKTDQPKGRKLFEPYWNKAVGQLEGLIKKEKTDWEKESLLGRFYQVGLTMDIKEAWLKAEAHLQNAVKLNPNLPSVNHLALGALYCSKLFSFSMSEKDNNPKLIVKFKSLDPKMISLAESELRLDNQFPGTSNLYLFLIYYGQAKFADALHQANQYLAVYPDDEWVKKLRGMANSRVDNKNPPGELNVYIERDKTRQLFDFYFLQGHKSDLPQTGVSGNHYLQILEEIMYNGLEFKLGETRAEIIKNLGTPMKIETEKIENRHQDEVIDTIYKLNYDGLAVEIYDAQGKEFIIYQKITSQKYQVKYGLNIGVTKEYVQKVLGKPTEETDNQFFYVYPYSVVDQYLWFTFQKNKVSEIKWYFNFD